MALSRKTKIIVGVVAVLLIAAVIIGSIFATRGIHRKLRLQGRNQEKELRSTVTSSGEVRPIQFMNLTSEVQGRIEEIHVKEGDQVIKGQPLVRLDPNQLQSNTDAQLAAFQASQDEVRVSQSQVTAAQNNYAQPSSSITSLRLRSTLHVRRS
ncbi:MAG: biotin/lipoyl-binding protein [Chloracidobacterium sp.]|nr:biotin/lipoyl-binding protein [Chloracidobacterium sp.]